MLRGLLYFLKLSLYWMVFFTLYRVAFILLYPSKIPDGKYAETLTSFLYGFRLDIATIAYLVAIPLLLWAIQQFFKNNFLNKINHFYNLAMISVITLLCISNIVMYGEWNALINYNTLYYLIAPAKMFPYMTTLELVGVCIGVAVVITIFVLLFRALMLMVMPYSTAPTKRKIIVIPILFPVVFIIMRGGIQQKPINETASCYSETKFIDHVSINPVWHLGHMTLLAFQEPEEETGEAGNIN
ncbi:MAG: hypothetical protein EPN85_04775 [Bacteroidetes bacterium]|nr:MAG: hypothetical protein EPN85_04775 [Bacteroidota bacterium]